MSGKRKRRIRRGRPPGLLKASPGRFGLPLAAIFLFSLLHLSGINRTLSLARRVDGLLKSCDELQRIVDRLTLEIAEENGGGRVVDLARRRLGMIFPEEQTEVLAVLPDATSHGGTTWTYIENAIAIAAESLQRRLNSSAQAREAAVPDSLGGP